LETAIFEGHLREYAQTPGLTSGPRIPRSLPVQGDDLLLRLDGQQSEPLGFVDEFRLHDPQSFQASALPQALPPAWASDQPNAPGEWQ
jgi:hypothetical protein